jgi:hypothetical protein
MAVTAALTSLLKLKRLVSAIVLAEKDERARCCASLIDYVN